MRHMTVLWKHPRPICAKWGFTIIELLVVISIMVLMLTMGVVSFNAMTGTDLQNASKIVVTGCNTARQLAISSGLPTALDIKDADAEPYLGSPDESDSIQIIMMKAIHDPDPKYQDTNKLSLYLDETDVKFNKEIPPSIRLTYYPAIDYYDVITVGSGGLPDPDIEKICIMFYPDGSSNSSVPDKALPWTDPFQDPTATPPPVREKNFIILEDESTYQKALIYVFPSTSYVKERIEE